MMFIVGELPLGSGVRSRITDAIVIGSTVRSVGAVTFIDLYIREIAKMTRLEMQLVVKDG